MGTSRAPASGCPICGRPVERGAAAGARSGAGAGKADPFPFCSARCQLVDLGRWLGEEYRVPDRDTVVWPAGDDGGETGPDGGDGGRGR
ncbi:MAG TPA: DNA gyrase inhibitor YacG [Kofleriaceae bacterium]|nr:DNA gyrase inhibitor YacG [Kofleriaceae bacterium]